MGAPSSTGRTPSWSHHWCSNQCAALGTHGCSLFHGTDPTMDPLNSTPHFRSCEAPMGAPVHGMDTSMEPWVLQPMFSPCHLWVHPLPLEGHHHGATIGAPTNVRLLAPMGAPSSMGRTQQWTHGSLHLIFHLGRHPWVHLSMGWTSAWSYGFSSPCSALGTHGCTLFHGTDPTMDPLISAPHF